MIFRLVLLCLCCATNAFAQAEHSALGQSPEEGRWRFDVEAFEKNKSEADDLIIQRRDGTQITRFGTRETGYFEYTRKGNDPREDRKGFYGDGTLKVQGKMFGRALVGVWTYYDAKGKLERSVDHDAAFAFGVTDLIRFAKRKKIDLGSNTTSVSRSVKSKKAVWTIQWKNRGAWFSRWTLSGNNGAVLKKQRIKARK